MKLSKGASAGSFSSPLTVIRPNRDGHSGVSVGVGAGVPDPGSSVGAVWLGTPPPGSAERVCSCIASRKENHYVKSLLQLY